MHSFVHLEYIYLQSFNKFLMRGYFMGISGLGNIKGKSIVKHTASLLRNLESLYKHAY